MPKCSQFHITPSHLEKKVKLTLHPLLRLLPAIDRNKITKWELGNLHSHAALRWECVSIGIGNVMIYTGQEWLVSNKLCIT